MWDKKLKCMSAITKMSVGEYLKIVGKAYQRTEAEFQGKGRI